MTRFLAFLAAGSVLSLAACDPPVSTEQPASPTPADNRSTGTAAGSDPLSHGNPAATLKHNSAAPSSNSPASPPATPSAPPQPAPPVQ